MGESVQVMLAPLRPLRSTTRGTGSGEIFTVRVDAAVLPDRSRTRYVTFLMPVQPDAGVNVTVLAVRDAANVPTPETARLDA